MVTNWLVSSVTLTAALFFVSEKQDTIIMPQIVRVAASTHTYVFFTVFIILYYYVYEVYTLSFTQ